MYIDLDTVFNTLTADQKLDSSWLCAPSNKFFTHDASSFIDLYPQRILFGRAAHGILGERSRFVPHKDTSSSGRK